MAVSWTTFPNMVNLLTLRNSLNVFNNAVKANIDTIEMNVSTLTTTKISDADTGLLFSVLTIPTAQSLTTSYAKVRLVDTVSVSQAQGHVTHDTTLHTWTITTTGIYKVVFSGAMIAPNGAVVSFNYNVNGLSALGLVPQFIGRGASPVEIGNHSVLSLSAGTVIHLEAKADSAISMTPQVGGFMVEKTHY